MDRLPELKVCSGLRGRQSQQAITAASVRGDTTQLTELHNLKDVWKTWELELELVCVDEESTEPWFWEVFGLLEAPTLQRKGACVFRNARVFKSH